jgi:ribosomal protein L29
MYVLSVGYHGARRMRIFKDIKKLKGMSNDELDAYLVEMKAGQKAEMWVKFTYQLHYMLFMNTVQYMVVFCPQLV